MLTNLKTWCLVFAFVSGTARLGVTSDRMPAGQLPASQKSQAESVADEIANLIQQTRVKAKLPPLDRLKSSHQLLQEVCSAAALDHSFKTGNFSDGQFFPVEDGRLGSADRTRIENEVAWKGVRRFEVAAWPINSATPSSSQRYWVGIRILAGSFMEFVVAHFSDDVYHSHEWKKNVVQGCRGVK